MSHQPEKITARSASLSNIGSAESHQPDGIASPDFYAGAKITSRTAAHLARNPLTIALGYAQLEMRRGNIPTEVGEKLVRSIEQAISGLDQLQDTVRLGGLKTREDGETGPIFDLGIQPWENNPINPSSRFALRRSPN